MLKKRVLKRLLPLLFSFCCVFSGFLSVNAFAYSYFPGSLVYSGSLEGIFYTDSGYYDTFRSSSYNGEYYQLSNSSMSGISYFYLYNIDTFVIPYNPDIYDYYFIGSVYGQGINISQFTFMPNIFELSYDNHDGSYAQFPLSETAIYHTDSDSCFGFSVSAKLDLSPSNSISSVCYSGPAGTLPANMRVMQSIILIEKDISSADRDAAIIAAINNQTGALQGSIGQAADDVQQSIEDQYSGDPETEFSVDDVITQHNEKMGVLSFGSDVMLQFLDMFQSANVGTAELTLPGFNITVENVEYSVWPDYSFNFEQLNEWVPALMSVIRVMLPAFVWLMVLRYCIKVFEDNFLAK